jgi:hypothetical protein
LRDGQPGVPVGLSFRPRLLKRAVRGTLQLVVQDDALDATSLLRELGLDLSHHPEQARVMPDLARLDPAAVVHRPCAVLGIAMVIEQRLALACDADHVCDGAFSETRHRPLFDQSLLLQRAQVVVEPIRVASVVFEVLGERHAVLRRALQEFHFRSAEAIRASLVTHLLAIPALGQREAVPAVAVDLLTRSR